MRGFVAFILCLSLFVPAAYAEDVPDIAAKAAVLIERTSGRVLYADNELEILPIASTTKVMTALLAIENSSLGEVVTAGRNASGVEGTSIYLGVGEQLSMRNMLYGLMLRSGNDAAVAIAEHIDGTTQAFAQRMNRRAFELGAEANFVTPNGLDKDGNGASALGIARIAAEALKYPAFREIVGMRRATIPWPGREYDRVLENKNRLLKDLPGATGVKTGFTKKAGRCLVFSCERDGMELVGAVLNCGTWFDSAANLIEWGFANYSAQPMWDKGSVAGRAKLDKGRDATVEALFGSKLVIPLTQDERPEVITQLFSLSAPVIEGQIIGHAQVNIGGVTVCNVDLVAANDVDVATGFWDSLWRVVRNWFAWR